MQTDEELVKSALQGADGAFNELVQRYQVRLLRFLLTRTNSREDAEDAIQDTFISAYRYLYSFDSRWRFSTWLYRIALRNLPARAVLPGQRVENVEQLVADSGDPLQACINDGEHENVWLTARAVLQDDVYAALWLRYVEDLSVRDVARVLEKSVSWTKVNLMRGRRRLQKVLTNDIREPVSTGSLV